MAKLIPIDEPDPLQEALDRVASLERQLLHVEKRLALYEKPSGSKLYYALVRKQNEMADLLNEKMLKDVIAESDKTFERMRYLWTDSKDLVLDTKILAEAVGVTGDEIKDTSKTVTFLDKNAT
jgi:hypothetical protein